MKLKTVILRRVCASIHEAGGPRIGRIPRIPELQDFLHAGFIAPEDLERLVSFSPFPVNGFFPSLEVRREAAVALSVHSPGSGVWSAESERGFLPCLLILWHEAPRPEVLMLASGSAPSAFGLLPSPYCEAMAMAPGFLGESVSLDGRLFSFPVGESAPSGPPDARRRFLEKLASRPRSAQHPGTPFSRPEGPLPKREFWNLAMALLPALYPVKGGGKRLLVNPLDLAGIANPLRRRLQRRDLESARQAVQRLSSFWLFLSGCWHQLLMVESWPADGLSPAVLAPNRELREKAAFGCRGAFADLSACLLLGSLQQRLYLNACHLLDLQGAARKPKEPVQVPWAQLSVWLSGKDRTVSSSGMFRQRVRKSLESLHERGLIVLQSLGTGGGGRGLRCRPVAFSAPESLLDARAAMRRPGTYAGLSPGRFTAVIQSARQVASHWLSRGIPVEGIRGDLPLLSGRLA